MRRATGLGWFGVGVGLAQLLAPSRVARLIGARDSSRTRAVLQGYGARGLAGGLGILMGRVMTGWVWARVAGDALDLATLGLVVAAAKRRSRRTRAINATAAVAGVTALDVVTALQLTRNPARQAASGIEVKSAVTVNRSPSDVYDYWRKLDNLPRVMTHLESVDSTGSRTTWRAKAPLGKTVTWQAEITEDIPNERIAWCSLPGSTVPNHGSVRFRPAPDGRGTEVLVSLKYDIPGGSLARGVAMLFGEEPSIQIHSDLRRFKQMMEFGDVVESDASIHSGMHAARPPEQGELDSRKAGDGSSKQVHP